MVMTLVTGAMPAQSMPGQEVRVACVGNSITEGVGSRSDYPERLGRILGNGFTVGNFGKSGHTLMQGGDRPWIKTRKYRELKSWKPEAVVVKLGTNDSKPINSGLVGSNMRRDLNALIDSLQAIPSVRKVFLCTPAPCTGANRYGIDGEVISKQIVPIIKGVARERGLPLIDIHSALSGHDSLFPDKVHPNDDGAELIARTVAPAIRAAFHGGRGTMSATTVDLILFMGQSNMAGRGTVNSRHSEDAPRVADGTAWEFRAVSDPTRLYPMTKLFGITEDRKGAIDDHRKKSGGMVPAFVNAYFRETGVPVVGVSASEGGTSTDQWLPGSPRLSDAACRLLTAVQWLRANGYAVRHKYMVWTQGESDADKGVEPEQYKRNLRSIITEMRNAGIEHCFLVRIGRYNGSRPDLSYSPIIHAQNDFCEENADVTMVSRLFSSFLSRGMMKDACHYYQSAYNLVGADAGGNAGRIASAKQK